MAGNKNLNDAIKAKKDEFYTQLSDIEKKLKYYKDAFNGKVVLCNCDDPRVSNFFHYFAYNFERLGLKKLKGNGDFRSEECVALLKQADIVVTNPPFSLFREYVAQLIQYQKKFVIMGKITSVSMKEIFPLIKNNKVWLGASIHSDDRKFFVPDDYELYASGCGIDENGKRYIRVKGIRWFTNLDNKDRHEEMILYKKYNEEDYPKYVNYDAIEVGKTADIPCDYYGEMGVPITFLDKYRLTR